MSRRALGRGLKALIPQGDDSQGDVEHLPVDSIFPNAKQPRRHFDEKSLHELRDSIAEHGVLEPLIVRPIGTRYEIVVGERRWRASRLAGLNTVPAIVRELDEREATEIALVENLQREDLNPIEEAAAYKRLLEEFHLTQQQVAERVGKERSTVANRLRLLELCEAAQQYVIEGTLSAGHAKALLGVTDAKKQQSLAEKVVEDQLSVRQTEEMIRDVQRRPVRRKKTVAEPVRDPHWDEVEDEFRRVLGTKVSVVQRGTRGRIEIEFYGEEDIERILAVLRGAD